MNLNTAKMNRQPPTRPLSTSARVHPSYLPYLSNAPRSRGKGLKWYLPSLPSFPGQHQSTNLNSRIPPVAGVVLTGYAVATYRETQISSQLAQQQAELEAEAARRRRDAAMADAYGDRSSLEELERAMRVYEAQQGNE